MRINSITQYLSSLLILTARYLLAFLMLHILCWGCRSYSLPPPTGQPATNDTTNCFVAIDSIDIAHAFDSSQMYLITDLQANDSCFLMKFFSGATYLFAKNGDLRLKESENFATYWRGSDTLSSAGVVLLSPQGLSIFSSKEKLSLDFFGVLKERSPIKERKWRSRLPIFNVNYSSHPLRKNVYTTIKTISTEKRFHNTLVFYDIKKNRCRNIFCPPMSYQKRNILYIDKPYVSDCDDRFNAMAYLTVHTPVMAVKKGKQWSYHHVRVPDYNYLPTDSNIDTEMWPGFSNFAADFNLEHYALSYAVQSSTHKDVWNINLLLYNAILHQFFIQKLPNDTILFPYIQDKKMYLFKLSYPQKLYVWELRSR